MRSYITMLRAVTGSTFACALVAISACDRPPATVAEETIAFQSMAAECSSVGGDGEGCAVIDKAELVAGSRDEYIIDFRAGPDGIAPGGSVVVGTHHAWASPQQVRDPSADNFVRITVQGRRPHAASTSMFGQVVKVDRRSSMFHHVLLVRLPEGLEAGGHIRFHFGASPDKFDIFPNRDYDHEFRVFTDIDGDGSWSPIATSPITQIVPAPAAGISASVPAQAVIGTPVDVLIRMEDPFINVATDWYGQVTIRSENGTVLAEGVSITEGIGRTSVTIDEGGAHRLRLETEDGAFAGRSNPMMVFDEMPERRLYWAELHGHTRFSDGLGEGPDEYFTFGRDVAALDVIALTDHGHLYWPQVIDAVQRHYRPNDYVTILAQEAGAGPNHMNLYYRADDQDHINFWVSRPSQYDVFLDNVAAQFLPLGDREVMTGPHHSSYDRVGAANPDYPFGIWDERIARFFEVYSSHGTSEFVGNPRPVKMPTKDPGKYMQAGLAAGHKFAVIGASDNHDSRPGRSSWGTHPGGLAGIWATELEREAVWNALWDRHVYATSLDRIYLTFGIDDAFMGDEMVARASVRLTATVIGKEDTLTLEVLRDNETVHTVKSTDGTIALDWTDDTPAGEHFYYLRVTQANGERAWSTPIWVTRQG